jgi:hypothetical protein
MSGMPASKKTSRRTDNQVYLLPMRHHTKEDADDVGERLYSIRRDKGRFTIAMEMENIRECRRFLRGIGEATDDSLIAFGEQYGNEGFTERILKIFRDLNREGVSVHPIDVGGYLENPINYHRDLKALEYKKRLLESELTLSLGELMSFACNVMDYIYNKSSPPREKAMIRNIKRLISKDEVPLAIVIGRSHRSSMLSRLEPVVGSVTVLQQNNERAVLFDALHNRAFDGMLNGFKAEGDLLALARYAIFLVAYGVLSESKTAQEQLVQLKSLEDANNFLQSLAPQICQQ